LKVRKVNTGTRTYIQSVTDIKSGSVDVMLTPGKNTLVKVEESEFVVNNPSEIVAIIPELAKGNWRVRVITQFCGGTRHLKTPKKITFDKDLIVA
jgi:stress response protein SCP2